MENTTVYLIRHSEPFKVHRGKKNTNESLLIENEKTPLSINGEKMAEKIAKKSEFIGLDVVSSSNYVRTMSTAKYFAFNNNLKVDIDERFNERIHGVDSYSDLPSDFEIKQFDDANFKVGFGESQQEVQSRMYDALLELIKEYHGKKIAIVSHSTAIAFLLKKWCECQYSGEYKFKNHPFFNGEWKYIQTFKLTFNDEELCSIETIN